MFDIRCATKQGQAVSDADRQLVERAWASDSARYAAMNADVFNATVPVGSNARYQK